MIESDSGFLSSERLKSFHVQPVSINDILSCFPNRDDVALTNEFRQQFRIWTQNQEETWWFQLFHHMVQSMTSELADLMLQKPIFLLENNLHLRQYLPTTENASLLLFVSDDPSFVMWKRQLTLLYYSSESERTALLKSNHVQLLIPERMIETIRQDHLQLAASSFTNGTDNKLVEEIWKDLFYLKLHVDKLDKSTPFLVPVTETPNFATIQKAVLPTILGVNICSLMHPTTLPTVRLPYLNIHNLLLVDTLQWEHFLLEMNCQRPSIYLPSNYSITELPLLPSLTKFTDVNCARLGELILAYQTENTKDCLRQFPVVDNATNNQQFCPVSATFDETIVHDLPSLPSIAIPSHCRTLAIVLGVCVEYDLRTCVTILQMLSDEKNTNVDLYIQWLGRLQLYVRQQHENFNSANLLSTCRLYLPDQQNFYSLKDLLVTSDNEEHRSGIQLISKYLGLQWISPSTNQVYCQFKDLFRFLDCTCEITISHICDAIYHASHDKSNFYAFGDCETTLTENGMETIITLFQYLEDLTVKRVKNNTEGNNDLHHVIIESKHPTAPCGSPDDLEWRFRFTCNDLSKQLKKLIGKELQLNKITLPTIDRRLITKTTDNIVYACLETKIIQNLSKDTGKRHFILPSIARTCPLVLAAFDIDYVERRGKVEWEHKSHNMECHLTQLTDIFRRTTNNPELEVITAKYASVVLLLSDSSTSNLNAEQNGTETDRYMVDTNYPFWIFNKTVLLCTGSAANDQSKAIIATSALATLLHKRKYVPFDEAKSIAQQNISACTEFRSNNIARVAGADKTIYSYIDLLFPIDHQSIESICISIGDYCTTEQDTEEIVTTTTVSPDRLVEDRIYHNRVQTQNHALQTNSATRKWTDTRIVDSMKERRIGENAEHFFFKYLQRHYGSEDVTPTKNWRSSSRLSVYPQCRRDINDSAGFDFELHDTREIFATGSGSTTKHCYFEVKGTSGLYNEQHTLFHVSRNELEVCQAISTNGAKQERTAYFIVIVESCLDPEKISFGITFNW